MSDSYTLKQIIFGLRKEYIEIERQLVELKKYVDVTNKVESFDFHISGNPSKLFLCLYKKKNLIEKIEMMLGTYVHGITNYKVTNGTRKEYYYKNREICSINNQRELNHQIKQIVQTDFFRNIVANNYDSIPCRENEFNNIHISAGYIGLINNSDSSYPYFDYYPRKDKLVMQNEKRIITPEDIYKLLNLSIDGIYLNDYHRKILDNFEEKEIDIEDNFNDKKAKLQIIEEPKKLILRPTKLK